MTTKQTRIGLGTLAAAAVAAVTYLLTQGVLTPEIATVLNALIAGAAGYLAPKG
jgi:hypothetical protein